MQHPDPKKSDSSLQGHESQRRQRAVHKVRLHELVDITSQEIEAMVASGDIELMVRHSDVLDDSGGGWENRVSRLFSSVAASLDKMPEHVNRTIFVNIVAAGRSHD